MDFQGLKVYKHDKEQRKLAEGSWDQYQQLCAHIFRSHVVELVLMALVVLSFVLVILEADYGASSPEWMSVANVALMAVYSFEMVVRIFIYRAWFFSSPLNIFDLLVVMLELGSQLLVTIAHADTMPSVAPFRVVRVLRVARGYKFLVKFPMLALMVKGLIGAASAALYGMFLLVVILAIAGVFAVHFINPVVQQVALRGTYAGCERCPVAFANVRNSMLTFAQQIVAGDSWGQVTIPIVEERPETLFFFAMVFVTVNFTIMNVILAVIVDSALKASQEDVEEKLKKKAETLTTAQEYLLEICREMDTDGTGDMSAPELIAGFDAHADFRDILTSMDIRKEDMELVFRILDSDGNGAVDYREFVAELFKMKQHDPHTMLVFIKHYATEIRKDVQEQLGILKHTMITQFDRMIDNGQLLPESGRRGRGGSKERPPIEEKDLGDRGQFSGAASSQLCRLEHQEEQLRKVGNGASSAEAECWPPRPERGEARSLREELGEDLHRLRAVISEDLLVSMQDISQKLQQLERGGQEHRKAGSSERAGSWRARQAPMAVHSSFPPQSQALDRPREQDRLPQQHRELKQLTLAGRSDQVPETPQSERRERMAVPVSIWGMRACCASAPPPRPPPLGRGAAAGNVGPCSLGKCEEPFLRQSPLPLTRT